MSLSALKNALELSWCLDTCYEPLQKKWSSETLDSCKTGQCAVTALIVNDHFGGKIAYNYRLDHFWNILEVAEGVISDRKPGDILREVEVATDIYNGNELDLTRGQFNLKDSDDVLKIDKFVSREELLGNPNTKFRYELLKGLVDEKM